MQQHTPSASEKWTTKSSEPCLVKEDQAQAQEDPRESPEQDAGWTSKFTFHWISSLLKIGYRQPIQTHDIPPILPQRSASRIVPTVQTASKSYIKAKNSNFPLFWALYDSFRVEFWIGGICRVIADVLLVVTPYTLRYLIQFAINSYIASQDDKEAPPISHGVGFLVGIVAMVALQSSAHNHYMWRLSVIGGQTRAVLTVSIFEKSIRLFGRSEAKKSEEIAEKQEELATTSHVMHLLTVDTARIEKSVSALHMVWTAPLALLIAISLLIVNLRQSALAGFALLFCGFAGLIAGVGVLFRKRKIIDKLTQARVALTQEALGAIRLIKFFGWEDGFAHRITGLRGSETRKLHSFLAVRNAVGALSQAMPVTTAMIAFVTYAVTNTSLSPDIVFSSVALFTSLRGPLIYLPVCIQATADSWAALLRIQKFLMVQELENPSLESNLSAAAEIHQATFSWGGAGEQESISSSDHSAVISLPVGEKTPSQWFLENIDLSVRRGELLAIVGPVGAGKTSLLAALAGDMTCQSGSVIWGTTPAVCPQQPWMHNASLRDNITFGQPFKWDRYQAVIDSAQLSRDLTLLPHGDATIVGERGVVLSGGQKQRISLARAMYSTADLLLLDDPLSGVDATVGRAIIDEALCGTLLRRTRVICTHNVNVMRRSDRVLWLEHGRIRALSTYEHLMATEPDFAFLSRGSRTPSEEVGESEEDDTDEAKPTGTSSLVLVKPHKAEHNSQPSQLVQEEDRATRSVSWDVYASLIGSGKNSGILAVLCLPLLVCAQGLTVMAQQWLAWWSSDRFSMHRNTYIAVYAALAVLQLIFLYLFGLLVSICCARASKKMSNEAVQRLLRARVAFFDTTPLGRHMNRFSSDIEAMDYALPEALRMFLLSLGGLAAIFAIIIAYFYWFAIAVCALIVILIFLARYYRASAREVKRHESVLRSGVYARFVEGLAGASTLRTYGMDESFSRDLGYAIDNMNSATFTTVAVQRWLSMRQDAATGLLVVIMGILVLVDRQERKPSTSGLVLSLILGAVQVIQVVVREWADVEGAMNSTERLHVYAQSLPQESDREDSMDKPETHIPPCDDGQRGEKGNPDHEQDMGYQTYSGEIYFSNARMRYREELPDAIRDMNMHIRGGEHVAIVGRTGAGKSSIVGALFRLTAPLSGGKICIDGKDISQMTLQSLRGSSRNSGLLSIIPQDATLFAGTVRSNLDPFDAVGDDTSLWEALRSAGNLDASLHLSDVVQEGGSNLSLGQRQLLALARVLVRKSRILVCDEATAAMDAATDERIQQVIATTFRRKTVLCIAHRLRSVLAYDRVCVMEAGRIAELGTPLELFRRGGLFFEMCDRLGIVEEEIGLARRRRWIENVWSSERAVE